MKKILCSREGCKEHDRVFAHQLSERSIEIGRNGQKFLMTGLNWTVFGTCQWCNQRTSISCDNGKIDETELSYKVEAKPNEPQATPAT